LSLTLIKHFPLTRGVGADRITARRTLTDWHPPCGLDFLPSTHKDFARRCTTRGLAHAQVNEQPIIRIRRLGEIRFAIQRRPQREVHFALRQLSLAQMLEGD